MMLGCLLGAALACFLEMVTRAPGWIMTHYSQDVLLFQQIP